MSNQRVSLLCFYDGVLVDGETTAPIYTGGKKKVKSVNCDITYAEFLQKMYEVSNSSCKETTISVKYSYPIQQRSFVVDLENDQDLHEMIDYFLHVGCGIMVYIFKSPVEPSTDDAAIRTTVGHTPDVVQPLTVPNAIPATCDSDASMPLTLFPLRDQRCNHTSSSHNVGRESGNDVDERGGNSSIGDAIESHNEIDENEAGEGTKSAKTKRFDKDNALKVGVSQIEVDVEPNHALSVGKVFRSKADFHKTLREFAMLSNFELVPLKTKPDMITVRCANESCTWRIHAAKLPGVSTFKIKTSTSRHTCGTPSHGQGHRQATSQWIATYIKDHLKKHPDYTPNEIIANIHTRYGVTVSYRKAWLAKEKAIMEIMGSWKASYELLPSYCVELERVDPEAVTVLVREEDNAFSKFFWAFGPCIRTFKKILRPIISVDGTHLSGKYLSQLLVAASVDGNNDIFPVAFAVVEAETNSSWDWFLRILGERIIGFSTQLVIISDRQKGLMQTVPRMFPNAFHSYCLEHLSDDFCTVFNDKVTSLKFWDAAWKYTIPEFNEVMDDISASTPECYMWIDAIGADHWAMSHFPGKRYQMLTTNLSESFSSVLEDARKQPITAMVETIRAEITKIFYQRRLDGAAMASTLTPYAEEHLAKVTQLALELVPHPSSPDEFQIVSTGRTDEVNLEQRTCSCREFDILGLPCKHAVAAISFQQSSPYDFCESWFTASRYRDTYAEVMHPTVDQSQWLNKRDEVTVLPPHSRSPRGRPPKSRIRTASEKRNLHQCSNCKRFGHHRQSCSYSPAR